jgi:hypothetical protein
MPEELKERTRHEEKMADVGNFNFTNNHCTLNVLVSLLCRLFPFCQFAYKGSVACGR